MRLAWVLPALALGWACAQSGSGDPLFDDDGTGTGGKAGKGGDGGGDGGEAGMGGMVGCVEGERLCADHCVDTTSDDEHCGACNYECTDGKECIDSTCELGSVCGDGTVGGHEERDPPSSTFTTLTVNETTCRWDLSDVTQLYCNGSCSWGGPPDCDQEDADIFCKLVKDDPLSHAESFDVVQVLNEPGFACSQSPTSTLGVLSTRGVSATVAYQDAPLPTTHGTIGDVITNVVCSEEEE